MNQCGEATELPDDLTKKTIEEIIQAQDLKTFQTEVTFASGKGENFLGVIYRVKVTGAKQNGEEKRLNLILKVPPPSQILREKFPITNVYEKEVMAYTTMLPSFTQFEKKLGVSEENCFKYIECFKASGVFMKEMLVLEDMQVWGYKMCNRRSSMDFNHLKLALECLSHLHSLSFAMKCTDSVEYSRLVDLIGEVTPFGEEQSYYMELSKERALAVISDPENAEKLKNWNNDLFKSFLFYLDPKTVDNYSVLCHGDSWNNNILFKYEDGVPVDIRLLDWQIVRHSSPITDIAYLICTGTDEAVRAQHFEELLDIYYNSLKEKLSIYGQDVKECYPEEVFRKHVKLIMPYGLIMSFMVLPGVIGEAEDIPDMDELLMLEKIEQSDIKFENKQSMGRFDERMNGLVRDFIRFEYI